MKLASFKHRSKQSIYKNRQENIWLFAYSVCVLLFREKILSFELNIPFRLVQDLQLQPISGLARVSAAMKSTSGWILLEHTLASAFIVSAFGLTPF